MRGSQCKSNVLFFDISSNCFSFFHSFVDLSSWQILIEQNFWRKRFSIHSVRQANIFNYGKELAHHIRAIFNQNNLLSYKQMTAGIQFVN